MTFKSHSMEQSIRRFILQCRWRTVHGECVGCGEPVKHGGVLCSLCQFFRYCSPECLKKDRLKHKIVCEAHMFVKANTLSDYETRRALKFLYRAKLLDSEGNLISPSVMHDVYLVKSSSRFSKAIANLVDICKSDTGFVSNNESTDDVASNKQQLVDRSSTSNDIEARATVRQHSELTIASNGVDNSTAVDKLSNCESHLHNDSPHSNCSHSSNISGSNSNETNVSESFGSGWWGKASKGCSRKPTLGNESSKRLNSDKSHQMEYQQKSHSCKVDSSAEGAFPGSIETRERSESQTFGAGWWKGHSAWTDSRTTKHEVKQNSQTAQSSNETRQSVQNNQQRTSNKSEFSTGTSNELSTGTSNNCDLDKKCLDGSDSSKTASNNCALGSKASTSSSHTKTSPGNEASKTSANRKEPDSNDFGAGWWKHPTKRHNTGSGNSTKSTTEKTPTKVGKPKIVDEYRKQSEENCGYVNTCTDVSPFEIFITPEHILRFAMVASRILSSLVQAEAAQGRVIVMGLISVPGLWRASLGGSRVSLVVEIVVRISDRFPGVIVHDKLGHIAPVIFNCSESTLYTVPGTRGLLSLPISECLKPGTFVLLRAVKWENTLHGDLCIFMKDMKCVDFIFYELIQ